MRYPGTSRRSAIISRSVAAFLGGYALAALSVAALAAALAHWVGKADAVWLATIPAFLIYAGVIVYAFSARSAARAWALIVAPGALLVLLRFVVLA